MLVVRACTRFATFSTPRTAFCASLHTFRDVLGFQNCSICEPAHVWRRFRLQNLHSARACTRFVTFWASKTARSASLHTFGDVFDFKNCILREPAHVWARFRAPEMHDHTACAGFSCFFGPEARGGRKTSVSGSGPCAVSLLDPYVGSPIS